MNKRLKIMIGTIGVVVLGVSLVFFLNKDSKQKGPVNSAEFVNEVSKNISETTKVEKVQFDTEEEMLEYAQKLDTIENIDEVYNFIEIFLDSCSTGNPSAIASYYNPLVRENAIANNAFPFYDKTGTLLPKIRDIKIEKNKNQNEYTVKYIIEVFLKNSDTKVAELKKKDTIKLIKEFGQMSIAEYSSKTTGQKNY